MTSNTVDQSIVIRMLVVQLMQTSYFDLESLFIRLFLYAPWWISSEVLYSSDDLFSVTTFLLSCNFCR